MDNESKNINEKEPSEEEIDNLREYLSVYNKKYTTHTCSICDYPCGYVIINNQPYYDAGVNCSKKLKYCKLEERTEDELRRYLKLNFRQIFHSAKKYFS